MERLLPTKLTFEEFWNERKNLKPPSEVEIFHGPGKERIPFAVEIDQVTLSRFLCCEGVLEGLPTCLAFLYPQTFMSSCFKFFGDLVATNNFPTHEQFRSEIGNILEDKNKGILGRALHVPGRFNKVFINVSQIYDESLISSSESSEQLQQKFKSKLAWVIGHEIEHLRQPIEEFSRVDRKGLQKGSWVAIDVTRRLFIPWLGLADPIVTYMENVLSQYVGYAAYYTSGGEREARKMGELNLSVLETILKVGIKNEELLKEQYFWDKLRNIYYCVGQNILSSIGNM